MVLKNILSILLLNFLLNGILCEKKTINLEIEENYDDTTVEMITVETTTQEIILITDIPQADIDAAMNLDVGEYTTQVFDYANFHYTTINETEFCFKQYFKCILDAGPIYPVCSVNDYTTVYGFITFNSMCDVFLDNCRRKRHFWRILGPGACKLNIWIELRETRRWAKGIRPWKYTF